LRLFFLVLEYTCVLLLRLLIPLLVAVTLYNQGHKPNGNKQIPQATSLLKANVGGGGMGMRITSIFVSI
jgi:hypothetical protein